MTGGRDVTRTAGCHGGGEGGSGGCGGTGHPASATGLEVVGTVVVVGAGCVAECARRRLGRGEASAGPTRREGAEIATRPQPLEALGGVEPDVAASVATAATAVLPSTTDTAAHERFIRPDKSTLHCRGPPDHALGSSAPPMPRRSVAHGRESDQTASNPADGDTPEPHRARICHDCLVQQRISLVTLGVSDLARARAFYEALGWSDAQQPDDEVCFFQAGGMVFGLWTGLGGHGAPGIELAHNVRTPEEVAQVLREAERAGASIVRPAGVADWGGTTGAFADPDGYVWEVAHNPGWTLDPDGAVHI